MNFRIILTTSFLLILVPMSALGQELPKHGLKLDAGFGIHEGIRTNGLGTIVSFGYERVIREDRLRINSTILYGKFTHSFATDTPKQDLISRSFITALSYDIIHVWILSLTLAVGGIVDNTYGIVGPGGELRPTIITDVDEWSAGLYFRGGISITPTTSRLSFDITPLANSPGHYLFKINSTIGIVVRL